MNEAINELHAYVVHIAEGVDHAMEEVAPGNDPMPVFFVDGREENAMIGLPIDFEDGDLKDAVFGQLVPQLIANHRGRMAGFVSFSWQTTINREEGQRAHAIMRERGISIRDSAALRRVFEEDLGVKLHSPERRKEACTISAASLLAEAISVNEVVRVKGKAHVEWKLDARPPDDGPAFGTVVYEAGVTPGESFVGGRVIEGMRAGLEMVAIKETDWRNDV